MNPDAADLRALSELVTLIDELLDRRAIELPITAGIEAVRERIAAEIRREVENAVERRFRVRKPRRWVA